MDVAPVEAALGGAIAAAVAKQPPPLHQDGPPYYRQYGGVLYGGKRAIYVVGLSKAMIDRRPALIVRCTGTVDVQQAVRFARAHRLLSSVRGGHISVTPLHLDLTHEATRRKLVAQFERT